MEEEEGDDAAHAARQTKNDELRWGPDGGQKHATGPKPRPLLFCRRTDSPPVTYTRTRARVCVCVCMYVYNVHVRAYSSKGAAVRVRTMHFKRDAWPPAWCMHRMIETDPPGVSNIVVHANVIFEQRSAPGFPAEF